MCRSTKYWAADVFSEDKLLLISVFVDLSNCSAMTKIDVFGTGSCDVSRQYDSLDRCYFDQGSMFVFAN